MKTARNSTFQFRVRSGQTPLPEDWRKDLLPKIEIFIQTCEDLDEIEDENISRGLVWLSTKNHDENSLVTDVGFWLRFHKELFKNVWRWAGQFKHRNHANESFTDKTYVSLEISQLSSDLKYWIEEANMKPQEIAARFHERFLTIHPFQNGNGRCSRLLTEHLCRENSWEIPSWNRKESDPSNRRQQYVNAMIESRVSLKYENLIAIMFN